MSKMWKVITVAGGSLLLLAVLGGVLLFGQTGFASAQEISAATGPQSGMLAHIGLGGFPGGRDGIDSYLADALGLSLEELQAAQEEAAAAALDLAVERGLLTEEQAQALQSSGQFGPGRFGRGFKAGLLGEDFDPQALLADALDISVAELEAAQQAAQEARLAAAVEVGLITAEQAELLQARAALKAYLDPQAIQAEALGISVEELQAYQEVGASRLEILDDLDLTIDEYQSALQAAHEAALAEAVAAGVITQEQADLLAEMDAAGFGPGFGHGRHGGRGGRGGHGFPGGFPDLDNLPDSPPGTDTETETSLGS